MAALNKQSTFVEPLQDELEMGKGEDQDYDDQNDGVEEFALGTVEEEQVPKLSKQDPIQINEQGKEIAPNVKNPEPQVLFEANDSCNSSSPPDIQWSKTIEYEALQIEPKNGN